MLTILAIAGAINASVYTTHINGIHTHTNIALYVYRFMYRYNVILYTTCKDELYFCVRHHSPYTQGYMRSKLI